MSWLMPISPLIARFRSCHQTRRSASCLVRHTNHVMTYSNPQNDGKSEILPKSMAQNTVLSLGGCHQAKNATSKWTAKKICPLHRKVCHHALHQGFIPLDLLRQAMECDGSLQPFRPRRGNLSCISTTSRGEGTVSFKNFSSSLGILSWMSVAVLLINLAWRAWKISAVCLSAQLAQQVHWTDCAMSGRNTHRGSCHQNLLLHRSAWTWVPSRFPDRNIGCQQPSCLRLSQPRPSLCWVHEVVDFGVGVEPEHRRRPHMAMLCYPPVEHRICSWIRSWEAGWLMGSVRITCW